ncbi:hypothetical protein [Streptomyces sp. ISID311]|uniref:hypothetical protein n=1 Tax=Streptomyces TaxID=1883 RepID=UPI0011BD3D3D|nr:hypothetical protein [Streptomyces sp. ISID311]TXC98982.1 hypothetical protein FS847_06250 [Streptomyces sp. ISID311]
MSTSTEQQWWVIYRETVIQFEIVAVEPPPGDDAAFDERCAQLEADGLGAYVIAAPDADTAGDIVGRAWVEAFLSDPQRLAAADAYLATLSQPTN